MVFIDDPVVDSGDCLLSFPLYFFMKCLVLPFVLSLTKTALSALFILSSYEMDKAGKGIGEKLRKFALRLHTHYDHCEDCCCILTLSNLNRRLCPGCAAADPS